MSWSTFSLCRGDLCITVTLCLGLRDFSSVPLFKTCDLTTKMPDLRFPEGGDELVRFRCFSRVLTSLSASHHTSFPRSACVYPSPEANWACHWLAELEGLCFSRYLWGFLETFKWKSFSFAVSLFLIPWFDITWDWGWLGDCYWLGLLMSWVSIRWSILFAQDVSRIKMAFFVFKKSLL